MHNQHPLAALEHIPPHLQSIDDYQEQAKLHLPEAIWHYLIGGAMYENSIKNNRLQFQNIELMPRHLQDLTQGHTQIELFGQTLPHPIILAPVGHQQLFYPQGEIATALAAEATQTSYILSHFTNTAMSQLNPNYPLKWFQLYWQGQRQIALELIQQAEEYGFTAIVITIDAPHMGIRDRERKSFFHLPENMPHPHSCFTTFPKINPDEHPIFNGLMKIAPQWNDIIWLIQNTSLPIILKGILHPLDAQHAVKIGAKGIIISNHGGRILDSSLRPLEALQRIRRTIPSTYPVFIDGGIRRGTDVFKAIALGANAVLIGRPYIYGLATAGALGVAHVIRTLKEEFEITMALMGTATISNIQNESLNITK